MSDSQSTSKASSASMARANLLEAGWARLDSAELRLILDHHIGGPGQYHDQVNNPHRLLLPLGGSSCEVILTFRRKRIAEIERGPAFDADKWERVRAEVNSSVAAAPHQTGREFSFSTYRVRGSWRGECSKVQLLPPPSDAPTASVEMADHPFILEFPLRAAGVQRVTSHRRSITHRRLTNLLNVLLAGHTSLQQLCRPQHCWGVLPGEPGAARSAWVQQTFFANLGSVVVSELSPPAEESLPVLEAEHYYEEMGHDGRGLMVPSDLDEQIVNYQRLSRDSCEKFDRASFWFSMASRQWGVSVSLSFACLVSCVEALTERGARHSTSCGTCGGEFTHEVPGATARFRAFFDEFSPGLSLKKRRNKMYSMRSGILHGGDLMQIDQDLAFGWDPPNWNERDLHNELWSLTRIALRSWLMNAHKPAT